METILNRLSQISNLCYYLQKNSKYNVTLVFGGESDLFKIRVANQNNVELLNKVIENFTKKSDTLIEKELKNLAKILVELKNNLLK